MPSRTLPRRRAAGSTWLAAAAVSAGFALIACGDSSDGDTAAEETAVTPAVALTEIDRVEQGLADAGVAYKRGNADQAEELVSTAYLEHFELVEGPLEDVDEELNEQLEELIREELRTAITSGVPVSEVKRLVDEADEGLDQARKALEQN